MKAKLLSNIELIRIFSMLLIIDHHLTIHGIAHDFSSYRKKRKN